MDIKPYLYGDLDYAQELVDELSGTGTPKLNQHDAWTHKETVTASEVVGVCVDSDGQETESHSAMIVYSKTGAHIYPRKEDEE